MGGARVTLLCENLARGRGILGEHGLAWWIEAGGRRVLFDTGQGLALEANARALGIDLGRADVIVLSHGHYDHVGGLPAALAAAPGAALWMHPAARGAKFSGDGGGGLGRRISTAFVEAGEFGEGREVRYVTGPEEIAPGVWVTGEVPRRTEWEDTGGAFFLDEALSVPDPLLDDMSLVIEAGGEAHVVLGCAHSGLANILLHVREMRGVRRAGWVMGGLHLLRAPAERLERTEEALREWGPTGLAACHCTGFWASARLVTEFRGISVEAHAGRVFELG